MPIDIKPQLRTERANANGECPIELRIVMDGVRSFKSVAGYRSTEDQWDSKFNCCKDSGKYAHPKATLVNAEIARMKTDMEMRYASHRVHGNGDADSRTVINNESRSAGLDPAIKNDANIFAFMDAHIDFMCTTNPKKHQRGSGRIAVYENVLKRLNIYTGNKNLMFSQVNVRFLEKWQLHMTPDYAQITVRENMIVFKVFCNLAIKKDVINFDPFKGYDLPEVHEMKVKDRLTLDELDKLEAYALDRIAAGDSERKKWAKVNGKKQAVIYFLFGCYTGLRVSDWPKFNHKKNLCEFGIKGMVATKNRKPVVIPYHPRLERVLEMMKNEPLTMNDNDIRLYLHQIMDELEIDKHISTHCGRKTFAVTLCAERGISVEVCATLMAISIDTCAKSYYEITPEKIGRETEKAWSDM